MFRCLSLALQTYFTEGFSSTKTRNFCPKPISLVFKNNNLETYFIHATRKSAQLRLLGGAGCLIMVVVGPSPDFRAMRVADVSRLRRRDLVMNEKGEMRI
jgi:hypothetical protein